MSLQEIHQNDSKNLMGESPVGPEKTGESSGLAASPTAKPPVDRAYCCAVIADYLQRPVIPSVADWYPDGRYPLCEVNVEEYWRIFEADGLNGEVPRPRYCLELRDGIIVVKQKFMIQSMVQSAVQMKLYDQCRRELPAYGDQYFYVFPSMATNMESAYINAKLLGKGSSKTFDVGLTPCYRNLPHSRARDGSEMWTTLGMDIACGSSLDGLLYRMRYSLAPGSPVMMFIGIGLPYEELDETVVATGQNVLVLYAERGGRQLVRAFDWTKVAEFREKRAEDEEKFPDWPLVNLPKELLLDHVRERLRPAVCEDVVLDFALIAETVARSVATYEGEMSFRLRCIREMKKKQLAKEAAGDNWVSEESEEDPWSDEGEDVNVVKD